MYTHGEHYNLNNYNYAPNMISNENRNNENRNNENIKPQKKRNPFFDRFRKKKNNDNVLKSESYMKGDIKVIVTNY